MENITYSRRRLRRVFRAKRVSRSLGGNIVLGVLLAALGCMTALPLVYTVVNAFKPLEEFFIFPPRFFVINPTFDSFLDLADVATNMWVPFSRYLFNSVFVSVVTTLVYLFIASTCAYVLAKHEFLGKKLITTIIVTSMMFTSTVMAIPQYILMAKVGFIDTYMAIIFPALGSTMGVFLMKQFMESFPYTIIESARIEGAGEFRVCWGIVMPGVKPAWITLLIFTFQSIWNATGGQMIFTENLKVLPTMLAQIAAGGVARAGVSAAASLLLLIPPIAVFVVAQSNILETMASSGIKE